MPVYEVEQYETYAQLYRIAAASPALAIKALLDGDSADVETVEKGPEYVQIDENLGLSQDQEPDLYADLKRLGVRFEDDIIGSICSVKELPE